METNHVQKKRGATSKACLRCHRRKQRCVGYPACSNCEAANVSCSRSSTPIMRRLAGLSKEELLKKIEELESQSSVEVVPHRSSPQTPLTVEEHLSLGDEWQTISGGHTEQNIPEEQSTQLSPDMICVSTAKRCLQGQKNSTSQTFDDEEHQAVPKEAQALWATNAELRQRILTTYLESMHRRVPFCDYFEILQTNQAGPQSIHVTSTTSSRMKLLRFYMSCAIGATVMQLTGVSVGLYPKIYFQKALEVRDSIDLLSLVDQTEILLWIVLYKLRTSFSSEVWYLIGTAVRTAIDAELHREHHYENLSQKEAELHRCLFWAVYVVERNICWSLKRPFSLSDHDIDTKLPRPEVHSTFLHSPSDPNDRIAMSQSSEEQRPLDTQVFIATIRLSRINSQTYSQLYRVDQSSVSREQIPPLLDRLHQFEASLPECRPPDYDFLQLHIKNAIRVLIEPVLSTIHHSDYLIRTCLEAAGGVCQLFKKLRLKRSLGFSFTMMNSVFVAGMTICYIVSKDPKLWTPARANDLRVCSSSLYAAAERNRAVRKYCETLDNIIEAVSEYVEQFSNSDASGIAQSALGSPLEHSSPREAFDKLGHSLKELKFEFPSNSYPIYRLKSEDTHSVGGIEVTGQGQLNSMQWDSFGMFSDVDMSSIYHLFGDNQFP